MLSSRSTTVPYRRTGMVAAFALIAVASPARTLAQVQRPERPDERITFRSFWMGPAAMSRRSTE